MKSTCLFKYICFFLIISSILIKGTLNPTYSVNFSFIKEDDMSSYFWDKDSLRTFKNKSNPYDMNLIAFWTLISNKNDKSIYFRRIEERSNKKCWYALVQYVIDCSNQTLSPKTIYAYSPEEEIIYSEEIQDNELEFMSIPPNSIINFINKDICKATY